jgi:LysR family transcriptional regulator, hypochlorite-specific transcription factor HypT
MQLKWLEDFLALARLNSFAKAAESRNVTQPAFGRRIKELEAWVGVELIDRSMFPTQLTPAGLQFLVGAEEAVKNLSNARDELGATSSGIDLVRISTGRTLGHTHFPEWRLRMQRAVGAFRADVWTGSLHDAMLRMEQQSTDLVFCYAHPSLSVGIGNLRLLHKGVGQERLVAVSVPLSNGQPMHKLSLADEGDISHLALADTLALSRILKASIPKALAIRLKMVHRTDSAEQLLPLVRGGLGVAWLPMTLVAADLARGLLVRALPADADVICEVQLVRNVIQKNRLIERLWDRTEST